MSTMFESGERNFIAELEEKIRNLRKDLAECKNVLALCVTELKTVEYENDPPERIIKLNELAISILKEQMK